MSVADVMVLLAVGVLLALALRALLHKDSSCTSCASASACQGRAGAPASCPRAGEALAAAERELAGDGKGQEPAADVQSFIESKG